MPVRDLIIVGAGPSGLSAAIAAKRYGLDYQVIEQGALVNSIYRFPPQMVFFTTPELLEIGGLPFISPYEKPTRVEALRYYRKVVDAFDLQISFDEAVRSVARTNGTARAGGIGEAGTAGGAGREEGLFTLETETTRGERRVWHARQVLLAIGYYDRPVRLGIPGEDFPHVHHYYTEPYAHFRQRVVVVGGANSAAEAALELYRAGVSVTLVHRGTELRSTIKYWVRPDIENRIKEGSIAARFATRVVEITSTSVAVAPLGEAGGAGRAGEVEEIPADHVFLMTGYRADADLMRHAGITLNEREAPVCNPETFETNVPGLFVAGGATAGVDTGTVFIENGRFHGEKIVQVMAERIQKAQGSGLKA